MNDVEKIQLEQVMVYVGGSKKAFRCECGCNVFHKISDSGKQKYECNACGNVYSEAD